MSRRVSWFLIVALLGCGSSGDGAEEVLFHHDMDSSDELISASELVADPTVSVDGIASLRIDATGPTRLPLAEVPLSNLDDTVLQYRAKLRSQGLEGVAYLEMWCRVKGKGEFFSRALQDPLRGDREWTSQQTPFFLQKGQQAELAKLNLVIDGRGSVWIDQLDLVKGDAPPVVGR